MASKELKRYGRYQEVLQEIQQAFDSSGSVYFVNNQGEVCLRLDKKMSEGLNETEKILEDNQEAYKTFFGAVSNLMKRGDTPEDIVKDLFVAFENYLKEKTGKKDCGGAITYLQKQSFVTPVQKALLDKISAYRSDSYKIAHSGNSKKPEELDAIWFLDIVMANIKFIDRKLKQRI